MAVLAAATAYFLVWPREDEAVRADAIVVLAGGRGHRLAEGLRLFRAGLAPRLAISDGVDPDWPEANRLCDRPRILCFKPDPYSTRGEARWTAARGWGSILVVTSRYHVFRTRMLFDRCLEGRLAVVGADPPLGNFLIGIAWEWPKLAWYSTLGRGC